MADKVTEFGDLDMRTAVYAVRRMLPTAMFYNVTASFAQTDNLPRNKGDTLKFRRYEDLAVPDAPISEITEPEGQVPTFTDTEVTVETYGDKVVLTRKIQLMHEDPVFNTMLDKAAKQYGETSQKVDFNALKAGSNVFRAGAVAARTSIATTVERNDLRRVIRSFRRDGAESITKQIKSGPEQATEPVPAAFVAFTHSDMDQDIEDLQGFLPVHEYPPSAKPLQNEVGECAGIRFITTEKAPVWRAAGDTVAAGTFLVNGDSGAGSADVYPIIIIAANSWSHCPLSGKSAVKPIVVNPGKPNAISPMGLKGYIYWLAEMASVITNEDWVARLEVLCSVV